MRSSFNSPDVTSCRPGRYSPFPPLSQSEVDTESLGHIVCEKAEELKATLVVMGNHGKGKVAEFFRGSVSQYVSHHCKRPFLIVRGGSV